MAPGIYVSTAPGIFQLALSGCDVKYFVINDQEGVR